MIFENLKKGLNIVTKKDLLTTIAHNTAIKENTSAIIENATAKATSTNAINLLTVAQQKELLLDELLTKEQLEKITSELGLQVAQNGTIISTKALNTEKINEVLVSQGVQKETREEILSKIALTTANNNVAKSTSLLGKTLNVIKAHPIIAIITAIAGIGIAAFAHFNDTVEETKEKVDDLMSSYKSALDTANSNASRVEELVDKYKDLSKGVNSLGENISLASDEYKEYNSLVNKIAEMFPALVQGYTDEGNAILNIKGNVEQLRDAYKEARQEAYNLLIVSGKDSDGNDIIKQWKDTHDTGFLSDMFDLGNDDVGGGISASDALEQLRAIQQMSADEYREIKRITASGSRKEIAGLTDIEKEIGYGSYLYKALGLDSNSTNEEFKEAQRQAKALIQTYNAEIESALSDVETLANAYLMTNEDYDKLDKQSKSAASILANNLSASIADGFLSKEDVSAYVDKIVQLLLGNNDISENLVKLFQFEDGDLGVVKFVQELQKQLNEAGIKIDLTPFISYELDVKQRLNNSFGNRNDYEEGADGLKEYASDRSMLYDYTKDFTAQEVEHWLEVTNGIEGAENKIKAYESAVKTTSTNSLYSKSQMINAINEMSDGFDVLADIYNDIQDGEDFDFTKLDTKKFEEAFKGLKDEYTEFIETVSDSPEDINACQDAFNKLAGAYVKNSGILDNLTDENAMLAASMLKNMGVVNAEAIIFEQLALNKEKAKESTQKLAEAELSEVVSHIDVANGISIEEQALAQLALSKIAINEQTIDTSADVENIIALAKAAGSSEKVLGELAEISRVFSEVESGSALGKLYLRDGIFDEAKKRMSDLETGVYDYEFEIDYEKYKYESPKDPSGSGSEKDSYVEAFEKELEKLDELKESGLISEKEYLNRLRDLYIKYFKDREEYIDEFKKYEQKYLQEMYDLYSSVIGSATSILNKQLDDLEERRDNEIEQIEKEQEVAEKAIQAQIDAKQDEIDKIQEASDARQREIDLQKTQYELERLQNQKTRMVYKNGQMVYETDTSEIRNTREEIRQIKEDIKVAKIEKEIDSLEDKLESTTEYYGKLKESTNEYYDSMINGIQSMIDKWSELSEMMEFAENIEILKSFGISVDDILSGNTTVFENFKNEYIGITGALNIENEAFLSSLAEASGMTVEQILGASKGFKDFSSGVSDSITALGNSTEEINNVKDAVDEVGASVTKVTNSINGSGDDAGGSSLKSSIEEQTQDSIPKLKEQLDTLIDLDKSVKNVANSITGGSKTSEGGGLVTGANGGSAKPGESSGGASSLAGAIKEESEVALNKDTGIPAQRDAWGELKDPLTEADGLILSIHDNLKEMDGKEFSVTLNVNGGEGFSSITGSLGEVKGTTYGSAKAQGDLGLKEDTESLVGELGRELVVRNDKFFTVGNNGAEFVKLKRGDIVFNHKQTEDLLSKGHITSRGKAFANGNYVPLSSVDSDKFSIFSKLENFSKGLLLGSNNLNYFNDALVGSTNGINNIKNMTSTQQVNINIGDINLTGVQDVNGLANAITTKLPNMLLQKITKR